MELEHRGSDYSFVAVMVNWAELSPALSLACHP